MLNHAFVLYVLTTTFRIANCNLLFPVWILYLKILLRIFKYFLVRIYYHCDAASGWVGNLGVQFPLFQPGGGG